MNALALSKLTISHLRGAIEPFDLTFESGKKLTVIYGENGSGKTTICDALDFLGRGEVGSLANRGLGSTDRYRPSLGKKATDISVKLESGAGTCAATVGKKNVVAVPPEARPTVHVLRRPHLLELVQSTPGDRYAAISRFVDVSGVESSEAALRDLIGSLTKGRDVAVARVDENEVALRGQWEAAGKPEADPIAWARQEGAKDTTVSDSEADAIGKLLTLYERLKEHSLRLQVAEKELAEAEVQVTATATRSEEALKTASQGAVEIVSVLTAAQSYLTHHPMPSACPLCESAERVSDLAGRVRKRLEDFASLRQLQTERDAARTFATNTQRTFDAAVAATRLDAEAFQAASTLATLPTGLILPDSPPPLERSALAKWLAAVASQQEDWRKAQATRQGRKHWIGVLKSAVGTWQENSRLQKELDVILPRLRKALTIVEEERRSFTDDVLATIANEVGALYELVHPGEGLNKISLQLDPKKRSSLEIGTVFGGTPCPPQAYFSDSHLDTLGLCIFIALAARDKPQTTILVLDDVLASVDEPHVERLIEMIYAEALKFRHCVVTTHYRPWKQKLRWGWLKNGNVHFVELAKWRLDKGLGQVRSIPDIQRLRTLLDESPPDPQLVCAKAGVILEAVLDFLTQQYECPVPRRADGLYTLGDLLPAIDKKLRKALRVEVQGTDALGVSTVRDVSLTPHLDELTRIMQARNAFGCHFNKLSFDLLDADALGFGREVLKLVEELVDPDAGWPRNGKSGQYWATAGETRKLYPYKRPV